MTASTTAVRRVKSTRRPVESQTAPAPRPVARGPWYQTTWFLALASSVTLWLALSPLNWSLTAWVAPIGWLLLIRQEKLTGWRPYVVLWLAGMVHWLLVMEGVRQAYWALYFGWFVLAGYLGCYLPIFVGLARVAVHRWRVPLMVAAPAVWIGLELARGYVATGFSLARRDHREVACAPHIRVADLGGAYLVSGVVMLVAAALATMLPWAGERSNWRPLIPLTGILAATLGYGAWRLGYESPHASETPLRVALLQNSVDTIFGVSADYHAQTCTKYQHQAVAAAKAYPDLDLMIWPESVFHSYFPQALLDADATVPSDAPDLSKQQFRENIAAAQAAFETHVTSTLAVINGGQGNQPTPRHIAQIVGTGVYHFQNGKQDRYNAALLLSPAGEVAGHYYKMHRVMFGEYIPLGDWWPGIYALTPMPAGLTPGKQPEQFQVAGYNLAPNVCFESCVPHLIRRQVLALSSAGKSPDVLVNLTDDGWFRGSGVLDVHYNCAVFRAVEHRKPMLVAANTGFSVAVDGSGRILSKGPRREVATLVVDVQRDGRTSLYTRCGDVPAGLCLVFCCALAIGGIVKVRPTVARSPGPINADSTVESH